MEQLNQLLAEYFEDRVELEGIRVHLKADFIPDKNFTISFGLMMNDLVNIYNTNLQTIKWEILSSVESFWMPEDKCIIIRFCVFGDVLYFELPRKNFKWRYELLAEIDKYKDPTWRET
jgi:hypothetical protein